jgi:hypothetical protein
VSRILPTALGFTLFLLCAAFDGCSSAEQSLFAVAKEQLRQRTYAQAYATFSRFLIEHPHPPRATTIADSPPPPEVPTKRYGPFTAIVEICCGFPFDVPDDGFKELTCRFVQEAVDIVKEVNTIPWQNEDVRLIALIIFMRTISSAA